MKTETQVRNAHEAAIREALKAAHGRYCGMPPSCGEVTPCVAAHIDEREIRAAVGAYRRRYRK